MLKPPFVRGCADLSDCRVLVIEQRRILRDLIRANLQECGVVKVVYADNGGDGFDLAQRFRPDLIIVNVAIENHAGFALCRRLHDDLADQRAVILAAAAPGEDREAIFAAGAADLISIPINKTEFAARLRVHLESQLLIRWHEAFQDQFVDDIELARSMQEDLLPRPLATRDVCDKAGFFLDAHSQPSLSLGGDMWAFHDLGASKIGLGLIDFSGHGLSAALNTFRLHTLMQQTPLHIYRSPGLYLERINAYLQEYLSVQQFATMVYCVIDGAQGKLTFASAGAPPPFLILPDGSVQTLDSAGMPLGIIHQQEYEEISLPFPKGAHLFLYSDALTETPDREGDALTRTQMISFIRKARNCPDAPLRRLLELFREHSPLLEDDLTLLWATRKGM